MRPFEFEDALSVGNAHIDGQHRDLLRRFSQLGSYRSSDFGRPERPIRALLSELVIAITHHFIDEEDLLIRNGFPDYEAHAKAHAFFVEQLAQTLQMDDDESLHQHLPSLTNHLIQHMMTDDLASRPYLIATG